MERASTAAILSACHALGFAAAGVCEAAGAARPGALLAWLAEGRHGSMGWMTEHLDQRLDARELIPGRRVRSLILVADQYAARGGADGPPAPASPPTGRIARYARGRDYHAVMKKRLHTLADRLRALHPGEAFRAFVDTAPVLEREHAARAGLGFVGKHTLLINPELGSWLLLGGLATTLELEASAPPGGEHENFCGACTRCIDACPTGAIEPFRVDARRCISYLTIEHEGVIDPGLAAATGDWVFGCDICQEVCPYNGPRAGGARPAGADRVFPSYREREGLAGGRLPLHEVMAWTEDDRRVQLTVSAGKRATLDMLKRNAAVALANHERGGAGAPQRRAGSA